MRFKGYETPSASNVTNRNPTCNGILLFCPLIEVSLLIGCDDRPFTAPATLSSKVLRSSSESNLANLENGIFKMHVQIALKF